MCSSDLGMIVTNDGELAMKMSAMRNQGRAPGDTWLEHTYPGADGAAACGNCAGGAAGANAPPANPGAPPITGAGAAAITVYTRPSTPRTCCGAATETGTATITGPPKLTPGAGIPATGVGTLANHCPTDGAPAISAKTRTMTPTMMLSTVGGLPQLYRSPRLGCPVR